MEVTLLGTGTSDGVPTLACNCDVCRSLDRKDKRSRSAAIIKTKHNGEEKVILIDVSADFRDQALREKIMRADALFITHSHADHIGGLDLIRQYNFKSKSPIPVYANEETISDIKHRFEYFFKPKQQGGGVSSLNMNEITTSMSIFGIEVIPIPVKHGILNILGYRFNNFAYITDASFISDESRKLLHGVDTLILSALRYRPHSTHFSLQEAVDEAYKIGAKKTYFLHFCHDIKHSRLEKELPKSMKPAYDGLKIKIK